MVEYATEEEQIEAVRRWWRENGRAVITGVIIGVAALVAWRGWAWYTENRALAASAVYEQVLAEVNSGDTEALVEQAQRLRKRYGSTAYAALGAFAAARAEVDAGKLDAAADWLRWVMDNADEVNTQRLARARLARVMGEQGKTDAALDLLDAEVPSAYTALYAEIRGDLLSDKGEREAAAEAYRQALQAQIGPSDPELVQRKLNRVKPAGSGRSAAAKS